jgi:hypothetical protein
MRFIFLQRYKNTGNDRTVRRMNPYMKLQQKKLRVEILRSVYTILVSCQRLVVIAKPYIFQINRRKMTCPDCFVSGFFAKSCRAQYDYQHTGLSCPAQGIKETGIEAKALQACTQLPSRQLTH